MTRARKPYRTRMYIYACGVCGRWWPVATLLEQIEAKKRGRCMQCEDRRQYRIGLYKNLIKQHMQEIAQRAGKLPESQREVYRRLYRRRQRQWRWCEEQLEQVPV